MITRGVREYMGRDWQGSRSRKDEYWAERIARLGPVEGLRIADELRRQMLLSIPPGQTRRNGRTTCGRMFASPNCFAVPAQPAALELLKAPAPVLDAWGRWYVFGAQAVVALCGSRVTCRRPGSP